jgi:hypothetical protein
MLEELEALRKAVEQEEISFNELISAKNKKQ